MVDLLDTYNFLKAVVRLGVPKVGGADLFELRVFKSRLFFGHFVEFLLPLFFFWGG